MIVVACSHLLDVQGVSPAMAGAICSKAGQNSSSSLDTIAGQDWNRLYSEWKSWVQIIQSNNFTPVAAPAPDCSVSVIGAHAGGMPGSALQLVDEYYRMPEVAYFSVMSIETPSSEAGQRMILSLCCLGSKPVS